jgi:hypothetical protein
MSSLIENASRINLKLHLYHEMDKQLLEATAAYAERSVELAKRVGTMLRAKCAKRGLA